MAPKWYATTLEETVRLLNSNAALGLSHKSARVRYGKKRLSGERDFFYAPKKTFSALIAPCISDFSFWTLLLTAGVLALFEHTRLAVVCLSFLLLNLILSVVLSKLSAVTAEGFARGFRPKVKVIREGKLFLTDSRYIVRGDIVLLSAGDILPFDARLLTADRLMVSVYCGKDEKGKDRFLKCAKDPDACFPLNRDLLPEERSNMVTAGSVILSGTARAIVAETGNYTYIGALTGGLSLMKAERENSLASVVCRLTKTLGIWLLLITVPLTVIAFFLSEPNDLAISFMTVLALSAAVFPGWIITLLDFCAMRALRRFASDPDVPRGAVIRTASASEALSSMDVLMLFGKPMITDGLPHLISVYSAGELFYGKAMNSAACRFLAEKALLIARKAAEMPTVSQDDPKIALRELWRKEVFGYADFTGADREMLDIRCRVLDYRSPTRENPAEALEYTDTATEEGLPRVLLCTPDESHLLRCTHIWLCHGKVPMTSEKLQEVLISAKESMARGAELCYYIEKDADGELVFLGFFAFAEMIPKRSAEAFTTLSSAGVRTLLVLDGETPQDRFYARASGCCHSEREIALASEFHKSGRPITEGFGTYSAYLGFSHEELECLIVSLEKNGLRTGGVAIERADAPFFAYTTVSAVCGTATSGKSETRELSELPITGVRYGAEASCRMQFDADILIPRAARNGGGLSELSRAVSFGRRIDRNRKTLLMYLTVSFGLRAGWLLPALVGLCDLFTAVQLLFVGLVTDFFAGIVIACDDRVGDCMTGAQVEFRTRRDVIGKYISAAISGGIGGFLLSLIPFILDLFGVNVSAEIYGTFRGLSLILASLAFLIRLRFRETRVGFDLPVRIYAASVLLLAAVGLFVPAVGTLIGLSAFPGLLLILAPIAVLLPWLIPMGKRD